MAAVIRWPALGLLLVVMACLCAPLYARMAGRDPFRSDIQGSTAGVPVLAQNTEGLGLGATPIGPGWRRAYLLGADGQGRDVAGRLLYGGRTSLLIATGATCITLVLGGAVGLLAAGAGWIDAAVRWLLDMLWAFPVFLFAITLSASLASLGLRLGPVSIDADDPALTAVILGVVFVPYVARPLRTQVLALQQAEFVQAAIALGGAWPRVVLRHMLPEALRTLVLFAPTVMAFDLLTEASLSVLGVGVQPPGASWGTLIADGQGLIYSRPLVAIAPGLAVVVTVLLLNRLADGWRS